MLLKISKAIALFILFGNLQAETLYKTFSGYENLESALPAIFNALPDHYGYKQLNLSTQEMVTTARKYNDFGMVNKRVTFRFAFESGSLNMYYFDHQMDDKIRDEWVDCPEKLTKKDKKFFDEFAASLTQYSSNATFKKKADSKFYSNSQVLLQLLKEYPETAYNLWSENSSGLQGDFAFLMFLEARKNPNLEFNQQYEVDLEIREVVADKVPLNIVMYANPKTKSNPEGMHKNILKLNDKENYWFTSLKATIVSFTRQEDGTFLMVLEDLS